MESLFLKGLKGEGGKKGVLGRFGVRGPVGQKVKKELTNQKCYDGAVYKSISCSCRENQESQESMESR